MTPEHTDGQCTNPPAGWVCSRPAGHEGPCAASTVPVNVDYLLTEQHEERALGGVGDEYLYGYLRALRDVGLINGMEYEGWKARLERCPGPIGGGQAWCAYCGTIGGENRTATHEDEYGQAHAAYREWEAGQR